MKILRLIFDIFFEWTFQKDQGVVLPINLTQHYQQELQTLFFDELWVWWEYAHLESKIERYKYHSDRHISTEFVDILSKCVEVSNIFGEEQDWEIIPIPMHWTRYLLRGFHHTSLLACKLWKRFHCPVSTILKTKFRRRQTKLTRIQRMQNKKNSFFLKTGYTLPSHILLLDDVVSSWATLNEAARVLKEGWVKKIICFTLASNAFLCQNSSKSSARRPITWKM